jgi:hypothetical protein
MRKGIVLPVLMGALFAAGCSQKTEQTPEQRKLTELTESIQAFTPKQNTPDMAVKSWWEAKDLSLKQMMAACELVESHASELEGKLGAMAGAGIRTETSCGAADKYQRVIEDVQVQSETRAVILARAKNVAPPDEGASTDSSDQRIKDTGVALRYTLERPDDKAPWKIASIEAKPSYSTNWEPVQEKRNPSNHIYADPYFQ